MSAAECMICRCPHLNRTKSLSRILKRSVSSVVASFGPYVPLWEQGLPLKRSRPASKNSNALAPSGRRLTFSPASADLAFLIRRAVDLPAAGRTAFLIILLERDTMAPYARTFGICTHQPDISAGC